MIKPCLELLGFVDEIVVVLDAEKSTDGTERIARRFTDKIYRRKLESFAKQKNFGIGKASGEWILVVDADERVTPALAKEIRATVDDAEDDAYEIPRPEFFLGRRMRYGAWQEHLIRLIRKSKAKYVRDIHETFELDGPVGRLRGELWHFSNRSIMHHFEKLPVYAEVQSNQLLKEGHPPIRTRSLFSVLGKLIWFRLIRKRGYKDGTAGAIESLYQPFSLFCMYARLWEKQQRPGLPERYQALEKEVLKQR